MTETKRMDNEGVEVDLKLLLVESLRNWKLFLISALVLAVLFGCYRGITTRGKVAKTTENEDAVKKYEKSVTSYEKNMLKYARSMDEYKRKCETMQRDYDKNCNTVLYQRQAAYDAAMKARQDTYDAQMLAYEKAMSDYGVQMESYKNALEQYEERLALYNLQMDTYKGQMDAVQANIDMQEERGKNSVLLNMDPFHFAEYHAVWFVDSNYKPNYSTYYYYYDQPDQMNPILYAYNNKLAGEDFLKFIQDRMTEKLDLRYIQELIVVNIDGGARTLKITVFGNSTQQAEEIFEAALEYIPICHEQIGGQIREHELMLVDESRHPLEEAGEDGQGGFDNAVALTQIVLNAQTEYKTLLTNYGNQLIDWQNKAAAIVRPTKSAEPIAPKEPVLAEEPKMPQTPALPNEPSYPSEPELPEEPEEPELTMMNPKSEAIKYSIIGMLLGIVLCGLWVTVRFISKDDALDEKAVSSRYGISVLASLKRFQGQGIVQRISTILSNDSERVGTMEEIGALAFANIMSLLKPENGKETEILLVGSNAENIAEVAGQLEREGKDAAPDSKDAAGFRFVCGGDIMMEKEAVAKLQNYEHVLIVESKEGTSYRQIAREIGKLRALKKQLVGAIMT